jgi:ABC-type phosphate/phosphonate transport system substrate-binding protein
MLTRRAFIIYLAGLIFLPLACNTTADDTTSSEVIQVGGSLEALHDRAVTDAEIAFQLLFNELLAEVDVQFKIKIYEDHNLLIDKFKRGDLHAIFLSSLGFLDINELFHPTGRYVVQYGDSLKQRSLVLVNRETHQSDLKSLRNGKFSYSTGHLIGRRFLDVSLLEQNLPHSEDFFSHIIEVKDANTAIVDLYFKKVDIVVVPEFSYLLALELNPQISESIEVISRSDPMIYQIVGLRHDFPQKTIDRFEPYILSTNPSPRIQQMFKNFRMNQIHRATQDVLSETIALNERYLSLMSEKQ